MGVEEANYTSALVYTLTYLYASSHTHQIIAILLKPWLHRANDLTSNITLCINYVGKANTKNIFLNELSWLF